jgi:hypothetical protein
LSNSLTSLSILLSMGAHVLSFYGHASLLALSRDLSLSSSSSSYLPYSSLCCIYTFIRQAQTGSWPDSFCCCPANVPYVVEVRWFRTLIPVYDTANDIHACLS